MLRRSYFLQNPTATAPLSSTAMSRRAVAALAVHLRALEGQLASCGPRATLPSGLRMSAWQFGCMPAAAAQARAMSSLWDALSSAAARAQAAVEAAGGSHVASKWRTLMATSRAAWLNTQQAAEEKRRNAWMTSPATQEAQKVVLSVVGVDCEAEIEQLLAGEPWGRGGTPRAPLRSLQTVR